MIDYKKIALYGILMAVVYLLWTNWEKDYPKVKYQTSTTQQVNKNLTVPTIKVAASTASDSANEASTMASSSTVEDVAPLSLINIKNDVLDLQVNAATGNIVSAKLLKYPVSLEDKNQAITLLNDNAATKYLASNNLLNKDPQGNLTESKVTLKAEHDNYTLLPDQDKLIVKFKGVNEQGMEVVKTLTLKRGEYLINVDVTINNKSNRSWVGYANNQILRANPPQDKTSMFHVGSYIGSSYSIPKTKLYKKVSFADMTKSPVEQQVTGGWVAMQEHYFLTSWIPEPTASNKVYTKVVDNHYIIGSLSSEISVPAGKSTTVASRLYLGPELTDVLKGIAPGLDLTVDYGWLWFISMFIFWVMKQIYQFIGNWGWSIVIVTLLIKLIFYKLSAASFKSMANMRKLQPKLQSLKEKFGDDKAKLSAATMELYRKEKINPLGGCLPIVVQIPVFIALYWVLLESVQLRQAPFMFWIHDLSAPDPFYVLPVLMGLTMLIQQRLNPAPPDPTQAKVMMMLPVVFTILFLHFPSGLVLYWTVNNGLSILQQWHITRKYGGLDPKRQTKKLTT